MKKTTAIPAILSLIVGAAMMICVKYVTPACSGMLELVSGKQVFMKCHYTAVVLALLGILMMVNAAAALFFKKEMTSGVTAIALAVCAFLILGESLGIGICMKPEMACHVMAPVAKVLATVELILGLWMCVNAKKAD